MLTKSSRDHDELLVLSGLTTKSAVDIETNPRWALTLGAATSLLICTGGPSYFLTAHEFPGDTWPTLYLFVAVAAWGVIKLGGELRVIRFRGCPVQLLPVTCFCALALASVLWTVSPTVTPEAALLGVGIAAFGCWFGMSLRLEEQVSAIALATSTSVVLSLAVVILRPTAGHSRSLIPTQAYGTDWLGIFGNRNSLAAVSALGIIAVVGWFALRPTVHRGGIAMLAALLHLVTLWFSGGDTSLIALGCCAIAAVLVPALWGLHRRGLSGWVLFVIGVALIGVGWRLAFSNIGSLTSFVGRSPMLSSRRVIWADVRTLIHERPFLGYGYWGLWDNQTLTAATYAKVGSPYGSAHNSVLEVLTMLGAVGFVVYFQICVFSIGGVIRAAWFKKSVATWWWTLLLVYLVVQNVTESFVLWHSYNWVLFIAAGFAASKCSSRVVPTWLGNSDRTHEQHLERA